MVGVGGETERAGEERGMGEGGGREREFRREEGECSSREAHVGLQLDEPRVHCKVPGSCDAQDFVDAG